jgi:hypothetical protein
VLSWQQFDLGKADPMEAWTISERVDVVGWASDEHGPNTDNVSGQRSEGWEARAGARAWLWLG